MSEPGALVLSRNPELGLVIATHLAAANHPVALGGVPPSSAVPEGITRLSDDHVDADNVAELVDEARTTIGEPLVLVTVPGPAEGQPVFRPTPGAVHRAVDADLAWLFEAAAAVAPAMSAAHWGRIVMVTSIASLYGAPLEAPYAATMAGIVGLTRSLARELGRRRVTVNAVAAGVVDTAFLRAQAQQNKRLQGHLDEVVTRTPLRRLAEPADVAEVVAFLAADRASFMTGVLLPVDGGLAMGFG